VRDGLLSIADATASYGVIFDPLGDVDASATAARRGAAR